MRVGLTGGIASGKSAASAFLRSFGAVVIDYDLLAREVVEPGTPALARIVERFGSGVLAENGTLNRPALGAIVFADSAARRDLEAITHPAIRELALRREGEAGPGAIVVHDNPLLVEMGAAADCDYVIVIDAPEEVRVGRLVRDRGMSEAEARSRIAAQASAQTRNGAADVVVDNTASLSDLEQSLRRIWLELTAARRRA